MAIAAIIKSLDLRQLLILSRILFTNPRFIVPTYKATRDTIKECDSRFGRKHHKNNRTNAFRHALWNYRICEKCYHYGGSTEKALEWSRRITNLHEKLAPNPEPAKTMDLHNNEVGRRLFSELGPHPDIVQILLEKMKGSVKVASVEEISKAEDRLVFIEN